MSRSCSSLEGKLFGKLMVMYIVVLSFQTMNGDISLTSLEYIDNDCHFPLERRYLTLSRPGLV